MSRWSSLLPQEIASGAEAIKFAGRLDRLALIPIAIQFGFTVYAVQEKGEWRWKSIQFACDQVPARD